MIASFEEFGAREKHFYQIDSYFCWFRPFLLRSEYLPWKHCDQIWRNFANLGKLLKNLGKLFRVYFVFDKMLNLLWQFLEILGKFEVL